MRITQINREITQITEQIIGCCFKVHSELGPGFKEKIYHNALKIVLEEEELKYKTEKVFNVNINGKKVGSLKLDLIVEDKVIVEVKAVVGYVPDVFKYQVLSYLKVSGLHVGLLVNFGNKSCQIKRFIY
ncbi:MAG: GxxExxY protein [Candidatus Aerophobetes bacterium]|nr:GxxExxY protein [Candidatus Aerophobetes bacterium]